jgi:dihydroflavonol-4-reductase
MNLVTGGTGFVGAHVVRALLARGEKVRCLVRASSRLSNLEGLDVELAVGDVRDPASVGAAMAGARRVYHCAADYRLWARDPREIREANVTGTENVLSAAARAGVERVVHTSSVGALGLAARGAAADERTPVARETLVGTYKRSKHDAERVAESWASRGLPVVIVNPSTPVGELDVKPTPTGQMLVDFLNRAMPAYVDTGLNLVDVRDVAEGHLLAADRGKPGERYILGCRNLTLAEIFGVLEKISGRPAPKRQIPYAVAYAAGVVSTAWAGVTGREPRAPLNAVRMAKKKMFASHEKAARELGFSPGPVEAALQRAAEWFGGNGHYIQ